MSMRMTVTVFQRDYYRQCYLGNIYVRLVSPSNIVQQINLQLELNCLVLHILIKSTSVNVMCTHPHVHMYMYSEH